MSHVLGNGTAKAGGLIRRVFLTMLGSALAAAIPAQSAARALVDAVVEV